MRRPSLIIAALAIVALGAYTFHSYSSAAQSKTSPKTAAVKTDGFWTTNWDEGMAAAKAQKRPVIIDFYTDWCGWCKKLDKETYAAPEIQKRFKAGWVGIKVNPEDTGKSGNLNGKVASYAQIAQLFGVRGYPTLIFLDKDGNRVNLNASINYVPREVFGPLLDYVQGEMYKKNVLLEKYISDNTKKK